jgi:hypothetical protein
MRNKIEFRSSMFAALHNPTLAPLLPDEMLAVQRSVSQHFLSQACYPFHPNPLSLPSSPPKDPSFLSLYLSRGLRPQTPLALTSLVLLAPLIRERHPDTMLVQARRPRALHQQQLGGDPDGHLTTARGSRATSAPGIGIFQKSAQNLTARRALVVVCMHPI